MLLSHFHFTSLHAAFIISSVSECGPLDEKGQLRSGFKGALHASVFVQATYFDLLVQTCVATIESILSIAGSRVVADYELEEMCIQYEREDLIRIYLHKQSDFGSLSVQEEEDIIGEWHYAPPPPHPHPLPPRSPPTRVLSIMRLIPFPSPPPPPPR